MVNIHNTLMHQIKKKYKSVNVKEKNAFRRSVADRLLRKTVGISTSLQQDKTQPSFTYQRTSNKKTMGIVKMFLSQDDKTDTW